MKCNIDGSYINYVMESTAAWIIRDDKRVYTGVEKQNDGKLEMLWKVSYKLYIWIYIIAGS